VPSTQAAIGIGELSRRSGLAPSALRFYEDAGLITADRDAGGRRHYPRSALRRVAFIRAAQQVGLSLDQIRTSLGRLPAGRTPTKADWARLSRSWRPLLDARIEELTVLRDRLDACIGCGCLSLRSCRLSNPDDVAGEHGDGARYLYGDPPPTG
jgi:MerR family redox-sensitive transcriptional activator SoxR